MDEVSNMADRTPTTRTTYAALIYQAGICNVFALDVHPDRVLDPKAGSAMRTGARRVYQGDFRTAEGIARGLVLAGVPVRVGSCNMAGDVALAPVWTRGLDDCPFADSARPVEGN